MSLDQRSFYFQESIQTFGCELRVDSGLRGQSIGPGESQHALTQIKEETQ